MNAEALPKLLSHVTFFKGLEEHTLKTLAGFGKFIKYDKNSVVYNQKENGSSLHLIILGRVKLTGQPGRVKVLEKFSSFGELSFFDGGGRESTAVTETEAVLFEIQREPFKSFLTSNPGAAIKIIENLSRALREETSRSTGPAGLEIPIYDTVQKDPQKEDMLYQKEVLCSLCGHKFTTSKVRSKFIKITKVDDDLCNHYGSVNPLFYEINICPQCGYSFSEENGGYFDDKTRDEIYSRLASAWSKKDYTGVRDIGQAVETFKLALTCQMARRTKDSQKGMLYLKLGWLYRYLGDQKNEQVCLSEAVKYLTLSFEREQFSDPKSEINILYLIGVLNKKMGNYKEASLWLDRVLRHPTKDSFSGVVNRAREIWHHLREEMKEATNT